MEIRSQLSPQDSSGGASQRGTDFRCRPTTRNYPKIHRGLDGAVDTVGAGKAFKTRIDILELEETLTEVAARTRRIHGRTKGDLRHN